MITNGHFENVKTKKHNKFILKFSIIQNSIFKLGLSIFYYCKAKKMRFYLFGDGNSKSNTGF